MLPAGLDLLPRAVLLALEAGVHVWRDRSERSTIELRMLTRASAIAENTQASTRGVNRKYGSSPKTIVG